MEVWRRWERVGYSGLGGIGGGFFQASRCSASRRSSRRVFLLASGKSCRSLSLSLSLFPALPGGGPSLNSFHRTREETHPGIIALRNPRTSWPDIKQFSLGGLGVWLEDQAVLTILPPPTSPLTTGKSLEGPTRGRLLCYCRDLPCSSPPPSEQIAPQPRHSQTDMENKDEKGTGERRTNKGRTGFVLVVGRSRWMGIR